MTNRVIDVIWNQAKRTIKISPNQEMPAGTTYDGLLKNDVVYPDMQPNKEYPVSARDIVEGDNIFEVYINYPEGQDSEHETIRVKQEYTFVDGVFNFYPALPAATYTINGKKDGPIIGSISYDIKNSLNILEGINLIEVSDARTGFNIQESYIKNKKILMDLDIIANYFNNQLNSLANDKKNFTHNEDYTLSTVANIGLTKLREKAISRKKPQEIMSSLNLVNGIVNDSADLDMYMYELQYTFIATTETAKALKERVDAYAYNQQSKPLAICPEGYSCIGHYSLPTMGQPFFENGEERVGILWFFSLDFTKEGVYAEETRWQMDLGDGRGYQDFQLLDMSMGVSYGSQPYQNNGETNVKTDILNRALSWKFSLIYSQSGFTKELIRTWIMAPSNDQTAFNRKVKLHYQDSVIDTDYNVAITDCSYVRESGKIIGISISCSEVVTDE